MKINFDKIENECPKSYERFIMFIKKRYPLLSWLTVDHDLNDANLPICFCDFVDFFDSEGIIITILYDICWLIEIWINKNRLEYSANDIDTRYEAQIKAVYKAFEIMEGI
jgi:hypothetical protein